jgi:dTDP-4-dehydrorhamnose 3,5-epimerase
MNVERLAISDVVLITPKKFGDQRGFFSEIYNTRSFAEHGIDMEFVQDNHSLSVPKGTLRGIHFQRPPYAQDKLVRCTRGSVLDVAVDLRRSSPTFGKYVSAVLSAENWQQLLVPIGFGHAFLTLEANSEVQYKVSNYYSRECDAGIRWSDPDIAVDWGVSEDEVILSDKDKVLPYLSEEDRLF